MALIFISHSSQDNEAASRLKGWLTDQGFDSTFLDIDERSGIQPGEQWERRLYREIERSHAMILVVTKHWLESKWCFVEFAQARALGKAIFPIIEAPSGEQFVAGDIQSIDLRSDREERLSFLSRVLTQVAVQAPEGFTLPPGAEPYPGLEAFDQVHAAVYFGRDDVIVRLIEVLRGRRVRGGERLIAVLGASGSGKSSLLRAGLVPRLTRDRAHWIVLPPIRLRSRPDEALIDALVTTVEDATLASQWEAGLGGDDPAAAAAALARHLRRQAKTLDAQIVIPIDQLEEAFTAAAPEPRARFLSLLALLLRGESPFLAVATLRSDYLSELQGTPLATAFHAFPLEPMPADRIGMAIRGPARVAGIRVDDDLVTAILHDARTTDALPLVAFTLRQLYDRHGRDGHMSLADYESLGDRAAGLTPLAHAVRVAAEECLPSESRTREEDSLLREAFIPHLVRVNAEGRFVRQAAPLARLPGRTRPFIEKLIEARLLVRRSSDGSAGAEAYVEVAHEALFRVWPDLAHWLEEERDFLVGKGRLEAALKDWRALPEEERVRGLLGGVLLDRGKAWLEEHPERLTPEEREFVRASATHEEDRLREQFERVKAERDRALEAERQAERNLSLALRATDGLALGIAREIEQNYDVPTDEKIFLAQRLVRSLDELQGGTVGAAALRTRSADLHATLAFMLFDVGRFDEATELATRAEELFGRPDGDAVEDAIVHARVLLAAGLARTFSWRLPEAAAMLDRAESLVSDDSADDEGTVLRARIMGAQAELLRAGVVYHESIARARAGIDYVRAALAGRTGRQAGDLVVRALDQERVKLHRTWYMCVNNTGQVVDCHDIEGGVRSALEDARPRATGWETEWNVAEAFRYEVLAAAQVRDEAQDRARESVGLCIEKLQRGIQRDPANLRTRARLGVVLGDRMALAHAAGDPQQVAEDLVAIRQITASLRRDSANDALAFLLTCQTDSHEANIAAKENGEIPVGRLLARIGVHRRRHGTHPKVERGELLARAARIRSLAEAGQYPFALEEAARALAGLDRFAAAGADTEDTAALGCYIVQPLIETAAEKLGREEWDSIVDRAMGYLRTVAGTRVARTWTATFCINIGQQRARDGRIDDALDAFARSAQANQATANRDPGDFNDWLFATGRSIELHTGRRNWPDVLALAREALSIVGGAAATEPPIPAPPQVLEYVGRVAADATSAAREEASTDAAALEEASAQLGSGIDALRERLARDADTAAESRQAFDLRELDIGDLKAGWKDDHLLVHRRLGWVTRSIYPGPWRTLVAPDFERAAAVIASAWGIAEADIERIRACPLIFYDGGHLFEAEYADSERGTRAVALIAVGDDIHRLDGSSDPIHACNDATPITLRTADAVAAYLRFFGSYVIGDEGSFQPVEEVEDLPWRATARPETRLEVARLLRPLAVWPYPDIPGRWRATATIRYGDGLFHATLAIDSTGLVEMEEDEPMAGGLPLNPPRYASGRRESGHVEVIDLDLLGATDARSSAEADTLLAMVEARPQARPAHAVEILEDAAALILADARAASPANGNELAARHARVLRLLEQRAAFDVACHVQTELVAFHRSRLEAGNGDEAALRTALSDGLSELARLTLLAGDAAAAERNAREALSLMETHEAARIALEQAMRVLAGGAD